MCVLSLGPFCFYSSFTFTSSILDSLSAHVFIYFLLSQCIVSMNDETVFNELIFLDFELMVFIYVSGDFSR